MSTLNGHSTAQNPEGTKTRFIHTYDCSALHTGSRRSIHSRRLCMMALRSARRRSEIVYQSGSTQPRNTRRLIGARRCTTMIMETVVDLDVVHLIIGIPLQVQSALHSASPKPFSMRDLLDVEGCDHYEWRLVACPDEMPTTTYHAIGEAARSPAS